MKREKDGECHEYNTAQQWHGGECPGLKQNSWNVAECPLASCGGQKGPEEQWM